MVLSEQTPGYKNNNGGLRVEGSFCRESRLILKLRFTNFTNQNVNNFKIQFNKKYFGLSVEINSLQTLSISPGSTSEVKIPIEPNINSDYTKLPNERPPIYIETGIAASLDEYFFSIPLLFCVLFVQSPNYLSKEEFLSGWKSIVTTNDMCVSFNNLNPRYKGAYAIEQRFKENNQPLQPNIDTPKENEKKEEIIQNENKAEEIKKIKRRKTEFFEDVINGDKITLSPISFQKFRWRFVK